MLKIFEPLEFKDAKPRRPRQKHVVQQGDTLKGIAGRYGMKVAEVRAINDMWTGKVSVGQELLVNLKKRSQSMPHLMDAVHYAPKMEHEEREAQPEDSPRRDEPETAFEAGFYKYGRKLRVIFEGHKLPFPSLTINSRTTECSNQVEEEQDTKSIGVRRGKLRSQSHRWLTNQEQENDTFGLPKLLGAGSEEILSDARYGPTLVPKLEACLPMSCHGYDWKLLYSLSQHGSSLHTLMRRVRGQRAAVIIVETCQGDVFGGFNSVEWANSMSYYGTGESFVFTCLPKFEVHSWKRTNSMFMLSNDRSIAMGGGGGFAWYLNADLSRGTSASCKTYMNKCLTAEPDFDIAGVEVWGFIPKY